jgi:hypothetical protein
VDFDTPHITVRSKSSPAKVFFVVFNEGKDLAILKFIVLTSSMQDWCKEAPLLSTKIVYPAPRSTLCRLNGISRGRIQHAHGMAKRIAALSMGFKR